jgi:hypothetical protein
MVHDRGFADLRLPTVPSDPAVYSGIRDQDVISRLDRLKCLCRGVCGLEIASATGLKAASRTLDVSWRRGERLPWL